MGNRQARPQRRAVATIEAKQHLRQAIAQATCNTAPDILARPASAEPLAFETQECNLVERVNSSQARIEFQAIDDLYGITEPDVLGSQIAVTIDD